MALEQLGRKPLFIAGLSNRILVGLFRLLPRRKVIDMAGKGALSMMRKVEKRSQGASNVSP